MDQLLWMFSLLPNFVFVIIAWAAAVGGVALFVASKLVRWIPMMAMYRTPAEIVGVVLIALGAYMLGGQAADHRWQEKVDAVEAQLKAAEEQGKQANVEIEKKADVKIKYIRGRTEVVREYVDREIVKYDTKFAPGGQCAIPPEFVRAHNDAAEEPRK